MFARCRPASRLHRTILIIITYVITYLIISHHRPKHNYRVVSENFSVGDQYSLIFLNTITPAFSDADGVRVFKDCGKCFVTNNRGFIPMDMYDAVLVNERNPRNQDETGYSNSVKRYTLDTSEECLKKKLLGCKEEPRIRLDGLVMGNLCQLCQKLQTNRVNT